MKTTPGTLKEHGCWGKVGPTRDKRGYISSVSAIASVDDGGGPSGNEI